MPLSVLPAQSLGATTVLLLVVMAALAIALQAAVIRSWTKSLLSSSPDGKPEPDYRKSAGPNTPDRAAIQANSASPTTAPSPDALGRNPASEP